MLHVYGAKWCPHCTKTEKYLKKRGIEYRYLDIEKQPEPVVRKVIEINGGEDWVVPTLEYRGSWRRGKIFDAGELEKDLLEMRVFGPEAS